MVSKRDSALVLLVFNEIAGLQQVFDRLPISEFDNGCR